MATIRATAARVPNRKRKRGPPAIKVPKGSNYSRVASKSPNVSDDARKISKEAEASEEAKPMECPRAGKIPNGNETLEAIQASRVAKMVEVTQAPELTNTPEAETTEAKTSEATKSPEVIETYEIIKRCAAVDGSSYGLRAVREVLTSYRTRLRL